MAWFRSFVIALFVTLPCLPADVVFGRRVYAAQGRSYQQIWTLDSRTGRTAPLTTSARRHIQPVCSADGTRIWFLSGTADNEVNTELWSLDPRTKEEKLAVQFPNGIDRLLGGTHAQAIFIAEEGDKANLYRWDGRLSGFSRVVGTAALAGDGHRLAAQTAENEPLTIMETSGAQSRRLNNCVDPIWSPDASKLACAAKRTIRLVNVATGAEVTRFEFSQRDTPPWVADFSTDGTRLLVGTAGSNHSSTSPQSDFWVLDIPAARWTFAGAGQSAIFTAGGVLLVTPRDLSAAGKGRVWTSKLVLVNPAKQAAAPVASGTAANVEASRCPGLAAPAPRSTPAAKPQRRPSKHS